MMRFYLKLNLKMSSVFSIFTAKCGVSAQFMSQSSKLSNHLAGRKSKYFFICQIQNDDEFAQSDIDCILKSGASSTVQIEIDSNRRLVQNIKPTQIDISKFVPYLEIYNDDGNIDRL